MAEPLSWLLPLLICPACRGALEYRAEPSETQQQGVLAHSGGACEQAYPVIDGIPRLLLGGARAELLRRREAWFTAGERRRALAASWQRSPSEAAGNSLVRGFDYEWSRFDAVGEADLREVFALYVDELPGEAFDAANLVVDAGCGAGRWAYEVALRGPRVIAIDLGLSVEIARRNTDETGRVACLQADVRDLPLAPGSADWAYSLGVLHHITEPELALGRLVGCVREGGRVLLYLYYALDNRGIAYRALFRGVDGARHLLSRTPRPFAHAAASAIAYGVYLPLARLSGLLERAGLARLAEAMPLSFYRRRSFRVMLNDSLDRFGTAVEHRYARDEVLALMRASGLGEIRVSPRPPYWHAVGVKMDRVPLLP